ncbi:MAG: TPM domain-containing protein [Candidatus Hydrogenedentes bacterium]|nr:TPM domain-containing protein [Candidatus Hydrogenedentota bacterium]
MNLCRNLPSILAVSVLCIAPFTAFAQNINIDPPADDAFVQDLAQIVAADDVVEIRRIADELLSDRGIPIIVVTVDSMSQYGGGGSWRIETFARILFDQWGIGHEEIGGQPWNRGILLVVSTGDRKARIELGADWAGEFDSVCRRIMDEQIVPYFKQGKYTEGILAGVVSLDLMSRDLALPARVKPPWFWPVTIGVILLAIFTAVSMVRNGSSGWAWLLWAAVFGIVGMILLSALRNSGSSGGFGGGSFGGGFGGGGGATGSW